MADPIRSRRVHYFHGFDPAATGRYRRVFAAAGERLEVEIADLPDGGDGWQVTRAGVVTAIRQSRYEALVREFRSASPGRRWVRGLAALRGYRTDGAFGRMARLGPRNLGLALWPVLIPAGTVLGGVLAGVALGAGPVAGLVPVIAASVVAALLVRVLYLGLVLDLFACMRVLARGAGPDWQAYAARIAVLAGGIAPAGEDETLVVGHSLGGIAAILALAEVLERWPEDRSIGLLTLGSTHGTVLVQRGEGRDRLAAAIGRIAADRRVFWVDVSSPRDAFCLPLLDPLNLIDARPGMTSPRVISARLCRAPRIPGDRRTVFAAMRRHMGYLLAPEPGSGFDYADTVSGRQSLRGRFGPRGNSPRARMWQP